MVDTSIAMSKHPPGHSRDGNEVDSPEPELTNDNPNYPTATIDHDSSGGDAAPPPTAMAGSGDSRRDNAESLAAATARGNVEIIEDEDDPSPLLPSFYLEWDGSGWTDSTAGWAAMVEATFDAITAAAVNDKAATANNAATVPGATFEAPNSPTAIATTMSDSSLAVALSSHPLGHAYDMYDNNTAADVGMDTKPDINNKAGATATGPPWNLQLLLQLLSTLICARKGHYF